MINHLALYLLALAAEFVGWLCYVDGVLAGAMRAGYERGYERGYAGGRESQAERDDE